MDEMIDQQMAMDEALVPHARRLRIRRSNFRLLSDISSKESNVLEIYMQEFWATTTVHHHSIRFKMDKKKHIINLESFREMLHICPRLPGQSIVKPPFKEEIMAFLQFLGHSGAIRRLTDVEHKDTKKSNEMYYPRDDNMFTTIKLVSRHQNTQQFGAMLPIDLINADIRNSAAYKEYYAVETGATPPKTKASIPKTKSSSDTIVTPPPTAAAGPRLSTSEKCKQATKASKAKNEGTGTIPGVPDVPTDESEEEISWKSTDEEGDDDDDDEGDDGEEGNDEQDDNDARDDDDQEDERDDDEDDQEEGSDDEQASDEEEFIHLSLSTHAEEETRDEKSFDPIPKSPENTDDEGNGEENLGMNVGREEGQDEEDEKDKYTETMLNPTPDVGIESIFETTSQMDVQTPTSVAPLHVSAPTVTPSTIATITTTQQAPTPPTTTPSTLLQDLPNFGSLFGFDHRLKTLEANFSEFMQTNQFAGAVSSIPGIVQRYMDQRMNEAVKTVNEQLEVEVLTRSSNSSKTSYAIAADLSEMELKKILIKKMEGNKSIHRSNEKRNLYKAFVEAYESDKIILDTYGDTVTLKRRHDDDTDKDEEPSAGSDQGGPKDIEKERSQSQQALQRRKLQGALASQHKGLNLDKRWQAIDTLTPKLLAGPTYELMKGSCKSLVELEFFLEEVYKVTTDQLDWVNPEGQQYPHNMLKPLPLIPNSQGRRVIPFDHFINNDLVYLRGGASSRKYTTSVTKTKAADYGHIKWIEDLVPRAMAMWIQELVGYDKHALWGISHWGCKRQQFYSFAVNRESARDVYSKRRIIAVTELKIVEWHNYKHLDWITMRKDDDKLYKFKEGDFKRLHIQDIEDMRVEDFQLGVESYQKKLNLTRPDTYRSDLKRKDAYIAYSNPIGFIYQNKDKQNRLMRIDELHKFSDGMLTDVCTALDDRLKGIRMKYLPQTI
nr:hypothetical protein [Tanacetum cinerariifolium]